MKKIWILPQIIQKENALSLHNNELYNKYDITANKNDSIIWVNKF